MYHQSTNQHWSSLWFHDISCWWIDFMIFLLIFLFQFSNFPQKLIDVSSFSAGTSTPPWTGPSLPCASLPVWCRPIPVRRRMARFRAFENGDFLKKICWKIRKKHMFVDCWYISNISIEFFSIFVIHAQNIYIYLILFNKGSSWNWMGLLPNFLAIYGEFDPNGRDMVTWHFYPNIEYPSPPKILKTLKSWIDPSGHLGEAFSLLPISESAVQPGHPGPIRGW